MDEVDRIAGVPKEFEDRPRLVDARFCAERTKHGHTGTGHQRELPVSGMGGERRDAKNNEPHRKEKRCAGQVLRRGTLIKSIRLTGDPQEIDCRYDGIKGLVLRAEFVKKR